MSSTNDVPPVSALRLRPAAVSRALLLLWIAIALGGLSALALFAVAHSRLLDLLAIVIVVSFNAFLIDKIAAGRNWARMALLVVFGATLVQLIVTVATLLDRAPLMLLLGLLQNVLLGGALYLVFTPPGNRWFKVF